MSSSHRPATARPVQPWARAGTWIAILAPIPSILWRLAMLLGAPTGFAEASLFRTGVGVVYVLGLCAVELLVCVACWGLIRPWGERAPRAVVVGIGVTGTAVLTAILLQLAVSFTGAWLGFTEAWTPIDGMNAAQAAVLAVLYLPFLLWPVPIVVALVGHWRRRAPDTDASA